MRHERSRLSCGARMLLVKLGLGLLVAVMLTAAPGCVMGASTVANLIGGVVDDADVKEKRKDLIGEPASAADEKFGEREDTLHEVGGHRTWGIYPVKGITNPLEKDRYIVEFEDGKVHSLSRVEKTPDAKFDIPRMVMFKERLKGKTPAECEAELEEEPVVTVRTQKSGRLRQLYDGRLIKILDEPYFLILDFDDQERCEDVHFQDVGASTRRDPYSRR